GRTGRAGKKGTAILIVPYQRKRRVEMMLRGARIAVEWMNAPTVDDIRKADKSRLMTMLMEDVEVDEDDRALGAQLLEKKSPEDIAAALVRSYRARMPAPEEMIEQSGANQREPGKEHHREGFDDVKWFRMDIGRRQNADPRWILPLICRRGHITKNEVGAIRIAANETMFQVPSAIAAKFMAAVKRTAGEEAEGGVQFEAVQGGPVEAERGPRRANGPAPVRHNPRPTLRPGGPNKRPQR
ncbi:MAG: DEAD/DEAH box helicase, partial [Sphingomonas sp.]|uniref:DEAD/DEAH box helicase n=3 Tax=Pseudomonadota TaxID=1224 RepID=UPI0025874A81